MYHLGLAVTQVVESLASKREDLSSNPSTAPPKESRICYDCQNNKILCTERVN
jgi:hypothetical protein